MRTLAVLALALVACTDSFSPSAPDTESGDGDSASSGPMDEVHPADPLPAPFTLPGFLWQPCRDLAPTWGCDGKPGIGLACLRTQTIEAHFSICVPQTADPETPADCVGIPPPEDFGNDVALFGVHCVPTCNVDEDCLAVQRCLPDGYCSWIVEG